MERTRWGQWWDFVVATDPGLTRLTLALQSGLSIAVAISAVYGLAQLFHPLWTALPAGASAAQVAEIGAQHHGETLLLMLIAGILSMISTVAMADVTPRAQAITLLGGPVPMLATLAGAVALSSDHWVGLGVLTLVVGAGTYARRLTPVIGSRAVYWGALLFIGFFFGFLAGADIPLGQVYWLATVLWLTAAVNLALRLAVYNPIARGTLDRAHRSFTARVRRKILATSELVGASGQAERDRDKRRVDRLGEQVAENALIIDAQLADPRFRLSAAQAQRLHEQLFELQLDLENLGRAAVAFADRDFPTRLRGQALAWIAELRGGSTITAEEWLARVAPGGSGDARLAGLDDRSRDVVRAVAELVVEAGEAFRGWLYPRAGGTDAQSSGAGLLTDIYESPVALFAGNLVGSSQVSRAAFDPATHGGLAARLRLDAAAQTAIRVMVAVGVAGALASIVSERRFYWAVIAVFISFMGANTTSEQLIKAFNRVFGTFIGILIGSLLANAIGPTTWSLLVIFPAVMFGVYFTRVHYALMAAGITTMISMLYVLLGEFSESLLTLRLELTALGAAIAMLAAVLILPAGTSRVTRQAAISFLEALRSLVAQIADVIGEPDRTAQLTAASRAMDDALLQLLATARPLAREPLGHDAVAHNLVLFSAGAHFARNLAATADGAGRLDDDLRVGLAAATASEAEAIAAIGRELADHHHHEPLDTDVARVSQMGRRLGEAGVPRGDHRRRLLRALVRLDGTVEQLAHNLGHRSEPD